MSNNSITTLFRERGSTAPAQVSDLARLIVLCRLDISLINDLARFVSDLEACRKRLLTSLRFSDVYPPPPGPELAVKVKLPGRRRRGHRVGSSPPVETPPGRSQATGSDVGSTDKIRLVPVTNRAPTLLNLAFRAQGLLGKLSLKPRVS